MTVKQRIPILLSLSLALVLPLTGRPALAADESEPDMGGLVEMIALDFPPGPTGLAMPGAGGPAGMAPPMAPPMDGFPPVDGPPGMDGPPALSFAMQMPSPMGPPPFAAMMLGGHHRAGGWMKPLLEGENALTDDQFEKLHTLRNDMLDKMGAKAADLASLERQLKDNLTSASIDGKKVADLKNKIGGLKSDLSDIRLDHQIAVAQVFTPEQRKALHSAMIKGAFARGMGGKCPASGSWGHKDK